MDETFEIVKIILPAGIVFLTTYYLVKNFLDHESKKRVLDVKMANQAVLTPIRLQAYERVILFLERINPNGMVMRLNKTGSAANFQGELLKTIRSEFEHNLSQQIYMSNKSWEAVVKAKEETIKLINIAATKVSADASAMDFAQAVIGVSSQLSELPTKPSIEVIKKEIAKEF
ncbi:MAG TPA: hypothetical protein VFF27_11515 [Bacteroidia bacterium]|jgi:hypothetical protein|nr:hypothetical protein [Bacteroidia bacterium]